MKLSWEEMIFDPGEDDRVFYYMKLLDYYVDIYPEDDSWAFHIGRDGEEVFNSKKKYKTKEDCKQAALKKASNFMYNMANKYIALRNHLDEMTSK